MPLSIWRSNKNVLEQRQPPWISLVILAVFALLTMALADQSTMESNSLCQALSSSSLKEKLVFPQNGTYTGDANAYFSNQERALTPSCIVQAGSAQDVAEFVNIVSSVRRKSECDVQFAVRSGGHTPFSGSANIDKPGVTLDLRKLNKTTVSLDRKSVSIEPGSTWGDVYTYLDPQKLAVSGGRVAQVGVGGLTLGGGLSFFSPRKGLVCDNVIAFDIVLADGKITTVTQDSHPDLWLALKGGSNNFGIVTSFSVNAFDQGDIFYGYYIFDVSTAEQQLDAFHATASSPNYDEYVSIIVSFGFSGAQGSAAVDALVYTKPELNPPALANFTKMTPLITTARVTTLADATTEQGGASAGQSQQIYITTTFHEDRSMLGFGRELWNETLANVKDISGIIWSLTYQPLPPVITSKSAGLGGNSLGLIGEENLVVTQLTVTWTNAADSEYIEGQARDFITRFEEEARARGLYSEFKYLNYANRNQDPIGGYGTESKARLQEVSRRYDPEGLFQEALPGGFKLFV